MRRRQRRLHDCRLLETRRHTHLEQVDHFRSRRQSQHEFDVGRVKVEDDALTSLTVNFHARRRNFHAEFIVFKA